MLKRLMPALLPLLFCCTLAAQPAKGPLQPPPTLSNASVLGDRLEFRELLSTTAQRLCSRHTLDSSRTSSTIVAVGANASATVPEYVRFAVGNNAVTGASTTATLSAGGATDNGTVYLYARRSTAGALTLYAGHNLPAATLTCGGSPGCTVETGVTAFPANATPIYTWTVTKGNWVTGSGSDQGADATCYVDMLTLTNTTGGAVTVTVSDDQTSALDFLTAVSLAANSTAVINLPGGARFDAGVTWKASANSSINAYARLVR